MNVIIVITIIALVALFMVWLFNASKPKDEVIVNNAIKKYPKLVAALLKRNYTDLYSLTDKEKSTISLMSKQDWKDWLLLQNDAIKLIEQYPIAFDDYIIEYFDKSIYNRPLAKTDGGKLFVPIKQKRKKLIAALTFDELRSLCSETSDNWETREKRISRAAEIRNDNPQGFLFYTKTKKKESFSSLDILRDKHFIEQYQKFAQDAEVYIEWEKRQEEYAGHYYGIVKEVYGNSGRYVYDIPYNRITDEGKYVNSKFKIWQSFSYSFSSSHLDLQTKSYKEAYERVSEFKNRTRFFYDSVYDSIMKIVENISQIQGNKPMIVFINNCNAEWGQASYDYHYKRLKNRLNDKYYDYCEISSLYQKKTLSPITSIFIVDFLTTNEDLFNNCKSIISFFNGSIPPTIAYHSFLKDYSSEEIFEILETEKKKVVPDAKKSGGNEEDDVKFITKMFEKVNKHPFFSYTAILNYLIGEVDVSRSVKDYWVNQPSKYKFKLENNSDTLKCSYSIDWGNNFISFQFNGNSRSLNEVVKYTYSLFTKMGLMSQFRIRGEAAINKINESGFLAHH